jgi:methylglyoxal synthase
MLSGPMEEMRKLRRVAEGKTKMVLFFKDPLASHAHEVDINMLLRVCDVHNVPIAKKKQLLSYYVVIELQS